MPQWGPKRPLHITLSVSFNSFIDWRTTYFIYDDPETNLSFIRCWARNIMQNTPADSSSKIADIIGKERSRLGVILWCRKGEGGLEGSLWLIPGVFWCGRYMQILLYMSINYYLSIFLTNYPSIYLCFLYIILSIDLWQGKDLHPRQQQGHLLRVGAGGRDQGQDHPQALRDRWVWQGTLR